MINFAFNWCASGGIGLVTRALSEEPDCFAAWRDPVSPKVIHPAVVMHVRFLLSLRNVEDLLQERGIDICDETARHCWNGIGSMEKFKQNCSAAYI